MHDSDSMMDDDISTIHPVQDESLVSFDSIPEEVLLVIFKMCTLPLDEEERSTGLVFDQFDGDFEFIDPDQSPLNIPRVCQTWRRISLSQPYLWTTIKIMYWSDANILTRLHALLDVLLPRTLDAPLRLELSVTSESAGSLEEEEVRLVNRVVECHSRWQKADLTVSGLSRTSYGADDLILSDMPYLEEISLDIDPCEYSDDMVLNIDSGIHVLDVSKSPKLTSLLVHGKYRIVMGNGAMYPHLAEFGHLPQLPGPWLHGYLPSLLPCNSLVDLTIHFGSYQPLPTDVLSRHFDLPLLKNIFLYGRRDVMLSLVHILTAPRIHSASFHMLDDNDGASLSIIAGFFERSRPLSLHMLDLRYDSQIISPDIHESEIAILRLLPSIKSLVLGCTIVRTETVLALTLAEGSGTESICPQLQTVHLYDDTFRLQAPGHHDLNRSRHIANMILSRWRTPDAEQRCLQEIRVPLFSDEDTDSWMLVELCRSEGLEIMLDN